MSRATQFSDRKRIEAFFRDLISGEPGLDRRSAEALAARCARRIKRVVVWDDAGEPADPAAAAEPAQHVIPRDAGPPVVVAPVVVAPVVVAPVVVAAVSTQPPPPAPGSTDAFDPYAFSVVVVLTKAGKDGLLKRLAAIERPEHLKKLAEAQHLAVDAALSSVPELRAAIVKAAEGRIANRRAAAS